MRMQGPAVTKKGKCLFLDSWPPADCQHFGNIGDIMKFDRRISERHFGPLAMNMTSWIFIRQPLLIMEYRKSRLLKVKKRGEAIWLDPDHSLGKLDMGTVLITLPLSPANTRASVCHGKTSFDALIALVGECFLNATTL